MPTSKGDEAVSIEVTIVCAACGKGRFAQVDQAPQFAVDLAVMAEAIGFMYVFDMARGRVVIFFSDRCTRANLTKAGYLRANIIQPKGKESE